MKIAAIVNSANMAVNVGGQVEVTVTLFNMPPELEKFIRENTATYSTVHLSVALDEKEKR